MKNNISKVSINMSRRDFVRQSLQLGVLLKFWAVYDANAKPVYNLAFWQSRAAILAVSEIYVSIAAINNAGQLAASELYASVAATDNFGKIGVSEIYVAAAARCSTVRVSEVFIAVVGKP